MALTCRFSWQRDVFRGRDLLLGQSARIEVYIAFAERTNKKAAFNAILNGLKYGSKCQYRSTCLAGSSQRLPFRFFMVFSFSPRYRFPLPPPHCIFFRLSLSSLQFLSFAVLLHFAFPLPFSPLRFSSVSLLLFPSASPYPLAPFVPLPLYDSSQLLPFLFYSFSSLCCHLSPLLPGFSFSLFFPISPSLPLSFSFSSSLLARAGFVDAKASRQSKCERLLLEISECRL